MATGQRPPPKAICVLLPVWGDDFITQFLENSLPTLLAPGNIPALAAALPTRFVFLTRARDEATFRGNAALAELERCCPIEFLPIDDLIMQGNHSTTVTLAYTRAVRQTDLAMLDTCFFFLVSDYVMADGSLGAVLARMLAGASAVQTGNFQLDEATAEPWLKQRLAEAGNTLAMPPREVMRWALRCLHPLAAANIINFPLCHNTECNRLLWRVNGDTLIGRFYLLHMICIRPETTNFVVGSSCDYSFVPEMCPSGNVVTMTDSDDYLVVELQPGSHENRFLRLGPNSPRQLAKSLSEWTTARHRANAEQTIVFHADALPGSLPAALAEADEFIAELTPQLAPAPQPHRNHPYWIGAIAALDAATARRELGTDGAALPVAPRLMRRLQYNLFGVSPVVTRVHPRWQEYERPMRALRKLVSSAPPRVLLGASRHTTLTEWLRLRSPGVTFVSLRHMMQGRPVRNAEPGTFDAAFIELLDNEIAEVTEILGLLAPLMRPGGNITLVAFNGRWFADPENFGRLFAGSLGALVGGRTSVSDFHITTVSRFRWWLNNRGIAAASALYGSSLLLFKPLNLLAAMLVFPFMTATNFISTLLPERGPDDRGIASSVFITFDVDPADPPDDAG